MHQRSCQERSREIESKSLCGDALFEDRYLKQLCWRVIPRYDSQIMQELVGNGVITVYEIDLFLTAGLSDNLSELPVGFNNISHIFSLFSAVWTLDRFRRRSKMVWEAVGLALE